MRLGVRETQLVEEVNGCFGTRTRACGLPANRAPFPWEALNGGKCRGYDTLSTLEYDYCGYWLSPCDTRTLASNATSLTHDCHTQGFRRKPQRRAQRPQD